MRERILGIVPPMITPFRPDETIDEDALRAETRFLIETARVHELAVSGSTGEVHAMTTAEVRRVTEVVVAEARGRVPIMTGIITDSTASAIERGKAERDLGVTALQVTPVHYLFRPDDDGRPVGCEPVRAVGPAPCRQHGCRRSRAVAQRRTGLSRVSVRYGR